MKPAVSLTLPILVCAAGIGWRNHIRLEEARAEHRRLAVEARSRGLAMPPDDEAAPPASRRERERRQADVAGTVARLLSSFREIHDLEKAGKDTYSAEQEQRMMEMLELVSSLGPRRYPELLAHLAATPGLNGDERLNLLGLILVSLSDKQPKIALELALSSPELMADQRRNVFLPNLLLNWATKDPRAALAWFRDQDVKGHGMPEGVMTQILVRAASERDPELAFRIMRDLQIPDEREWVGKVMNRSSADSAGRNAALKALREYLGSIGDNKQRESMETAGIAALATRVGEDGFERGSRWFQEAGMTKAELALAVRTLPAKAIAAEPSSWLEWAGRMLPVEQTEDTRHRWMVDWTNKDFRAAGRWLNSQADGPLKQSSVRSYAMMVALYDPESATEWALTLPEGEQRTKTLREIYRSWPEGDREGAAGFRRKYGIE